MSKERFEDMVRKLDDIDHVFFVTEQTVEVSREMYFWLEEQSKRVQELEEENKRIRQMKYHEAYEQGKFDTNMKVWYEMPKLEQQNKRYREAIKRAIGKFNYDEHQEGMSILQKALECE